MRKKRKVTVKMTYWVLAYTKASTFTVARIHRGVFVLRKKEGRLLF